MAVYAFTEDKLLVETYSKASIDSALAAKVDTTTFTQQLGTKVDKTTYNTGMSGKANVSHTHSLAALNGNLPFSRVSGLTFQLIGSDLYITTN